MSDKFNSGEYGGRLSFPGKILTLLLNDDQFYRDVVSSKRVSLTNFPKYDQWSTDDGFFMEFALAGFSKSDISVYYDGNMVYVHSNTDKEQDAVVANVGELEENLSLSSGDADLYVKQASPKIKKGVIVRGIARRSFRTNFFISSKFDMINMEVTMRDGLLTVYIPNKKVVGPSQITIK